MTEKLEIYLCKACGNVVEVLSPGAGVLVCCGEDMILVTPKTEDKGKEKHVPVVEKSGSGIKVKVGSVPHPMEEKHFIEWVLVVKGDMVMRKFLKPGQVPEAEFPVGPEDIKVYAYCNVHGLWVA